jgi:hypothetical protein
MNKERLEFAKRFSEVAEQLGYKGHGRQTSMATYYHKAQPSVKKWFDGDSQPDYEICVDLCRRARVHYEWLMTGRGPKAIETIDERETSTFTNVVQLTFVTTEEMDILTAFRSSSPEGKGLIKAAVKTAPRDESLLSLLSSRH